MKNNNDLYTNVRKYKNKCSEFNIIFEINEPKLGHLVMHSNVNWREVIIIVKIKYYDYEKFILATYDSDYHGLTKN